MKRITRSRRIGRIVFLKRFLIFQREIYENIIPGAKRSAKPNGDTMIIILRPFREKYAFRTYPNAV